MRVKGGRKRELTNLQIRRKIFDWSPGIARANVLTPGKYTRPGSNKKR
jgi:hypothetical protein